MSWTDTADRYERLAWSIEPATRLTTKDHWIWGVLYECLAALVAIFTLGRKNKSFRQRFSRTYFLEHVAITFGPLQAYPRQFQTLSDKLLVHECRHTTQCVWLGWLVPILGWFFGRRTRAWCGLPIFAILYLLILPSGLALGRFLLELDAERASLLWLKNNGTYSKEYLRARATWFAGQVCGPAYLWSFPHTWGEPIFTRMANNLIKKG